MKFILVSCILWMLLVCDNYNGFESLKRKTHQQINELHIKLKLPTICMRISMDLSFNCPYLSPERIFFTFAPLSSKNSFIYLGTACQRCGFSHIQNSVCLFSSNNQNIWRMKESLLFRLFIVRQAISAYKYTHTLTHARALIPNMQSTLEFKTMAILCISFNSFMNSRKSVSFHGKKITQLSSQTGTATGNPFPCYHFIVALSVRYFFFSQFLKKKTLFPTRFFIERFVAVKQRPFNGIPCSK